MIKALVLGGALGFVSSIPISGPVSALVFSHGMEGKYRRGRCVAFGAALVESSYAFLAFWGFNQFIADFSYIVPFSNAAAALIVGGLGIHFFRSEKMRVPVAVSGQAGLSRGRKGFIMGAGIAAVNPTLIATWTAAITTIYSMGLFEFSDVNSVLFSLGVGAGILSWFTILLALIAKYRDRLKQAVLDRGLKAAGIGLVSLSIWMAYRLITQHFLA